MRDLKRNDFLPEILLFSFNLQISMNARLVVMAAMSTLPVPTPLDHTPAPAKHPTQEMEKHVSIHSQVCDKDIALSGKTKKFQNIFEQS